MARLALSVAGAAIGNAILPGIGGQIGFAIGSYAGAVLFTEDIENKGPRIDDAAVTTSAYGRLLPVVWGVYPVAGNIIDASPVREVAKDEDVGGKGGPSNTNTTYSYYGDLDVAICAGEIDALLQIRMNGKIIFDASPTATVVKPTWLNFTLYKGAEDQVVDPTFEALNGAGNVSAYRGTAHIVFHNFPFEQSGNSFAPSFEFLVAMSATGGATLQNTAVSIGSETSEYGGGIVDPATGLLIFPIKDSGVTTYVAAAVDAYTRAIAWRTPSDGYTGWYHPIIVPKVEETPTGDFVYPGDVYFFVTDSGVANYVARVDAVSGAIQDYSAAMTTGSAAIVGGDVDWKDQKTALATLYVVTNKGALNGHNLLKGYPTPAAVDPPDGWFFSGDGPISNGEGLLLVGVADSESAPTNIGVSVLHTGSETWSSVLVTGSISAGTWADDSWFIQTGNDEIKEISTTPAVVQTIDLSADYSITDTILNGSSTSVLDGLVYDADANDLLFQSSTKFYRLDLDDVTQTPEQTTLAGSTLTFYHAETCRAWYGTQSSINARSASLCAATGTVATLDAVTSDLSIDGTELTASDIDVTDLATVDVRGFAISAPMARRNAIAMLQTAYLYDYVPRSGKLTGILRGNAVSATLTEDQIGAYIYGGSAPDPWTITRAAGGGLPDQVEVTFVDPEHNYEAGTQLARRQASDFGTVDRLQLALALTNDEAAQIADIRLHLSHIESEQYKTTTMPSTIDDVRPAEILQTTFDGVDYVYRVTSGSIIDGRMIEMLGAREVPEVFTNFSVGGDARTVNGTVQALGLTQIRPLDIPMLREQDDNAGIYVAGASYTPGWPGADVQRSTDGTSFTSLTSLTTEATIGTALNAPTTGEANRLDVATTLNVTLISGSLSSTTRSTATYAAWGVNGRFEIISFITASQHADGYWQVSDIARGVLDTGHAMSSHAIGDQFVVLSTSALKRLIYSASSIDAIDYVRGVTFGRTSASAISVRYTFTAESLEPYAPCRLDASVNAGDWTLSWVRQDRVLGRALWAPSNAEATETYTVRIYDEDGSTVVRTETVTDATSYTYLDADQVTDFGAAIDYVDWDVAQVSANTGNGHFARSGSGSAYNYVSATVGKSPTLYVRYEETTGTTAESLVGTIDGTYVGTPTLGATGILPTGVAVTLNGSSQYIDFRPFDGGYSTTWVGALETTFNITNLPASGNDAIAAHFSTSGTFETFILSVDSAGNLQLQIWKTGGTKVLDIVGSATLSTGTDYHVIVNFSYSGTCTVYLNGSSDASGAVSTGWTLNVSETFARFWIGYSSVGSMGYFDGKIDDLVVYPSNLTAPQIADQYARSGV